VTQGWLRVALPAQRKGRWQIPTSALVAFIRQHPAEVAKGVPDVRWLIALLTQTPRPRRRALPDAEVAS
jgi:hypothetical protein